MPKEQVAGGEHAKGVETFIELIFAAHQICRALQVIPR